MRGVILAGGYGTRMAPSTLVTNKHLLPVYSDKGAVPMLFYPIQTLINSGIREILIISSREHCGHIIENLSDGKAFGADFTYKIQDLNHVQLGIASALRLSKGFVGRHTFAVILGDNYFEETFKDDFYAFSEQERVSCDGYKDEAAIFVKEVDDPCRFGVLTSDGSNPRIEEKPKAPKTNLAVTGLYLYTPWVFDIVETLKPSQRGELEITDLNNYYCANGAVRIKRLTGFWSDMGTPPSIRRVEEFLEVKS